MLYFTSAFEAILLWLRLQLLGMLLSILPPVLLLTICSYVAAAAANSSTEAEVASGSRIASKAADVA